MSDDEEHFVDVPRSGEEAEVEMSLEERLELLEDRVTLLEDQFDEQRANKATAKPKSKKERYYAVLRGRWDNQTDDFVTGIFRSVEEFNGAMKGATKAEGTGHDTYQGAVQWYEENIERIEVENAAFRDGNGVCSRTLTNVNAATAVSIIDPQLVASAFLSRDII